MSDWNGGDDPLKGLKNNNIGSDFDRMQTNWKLDEVNRNLRDIKFNQDMDRMERSFDRLRKGGGYSGPKVEMPGLTLFMINFFNMLIFVPSAMIYGNHFLWLEIFAVLAGSLTWYFKKKNTTSANPKINTGVGNNLDKDIKQITELLDNKNLDEAKLTEHIQNLIPKLKKAYGTKEINEYFIDIKDPQIWKKDDVNIFELAFKRGKCKTAKVLYNLGIFTKKCGADLIESSSEMRYSTDFKDARDIIFGKKDELVKSFKKSKNNHNDLKKKIKKINDYNSWCIQEKKLYGGKSHPIREKREWICDSFYQIHNKDLLEGIDEATQQFFDMVSFLKKTKNKTDGDVDYTEKEKEFKKLKTEKLVHNFDEKQKEKTQDKHIVDKHESEISKESEAKSIFEAMYEIIKPSIERKASSLDNISAVRDHLLRTLELKQSGFELSGKFVSMSTLISKRIDYLILPKDPIQLNFEEFEKLEKDEVDQFFHDLDEKIIQFMNDDPELISKIEIEKEKGIENTIKKQMDSIVGQEKAKQMIMELVSLVKINKARVSNNMDSHNVNLHTVFSGSPGTGKTTFARIFANCIKFLGVLSKGHLVEVSRSDLVASYVGQTAIKTTEKFNEAKGGVLFIDEAYSLKTGENDQFGSECIDTLVKLIEDNRNDVVVILAGYESEMREFLGHNTGLKSRIPNTVTFEDFKSDELKEIMKMNFKGKGYEVEENMIDLALREVLKEKKGGHFGNARAIRNLVDRVIKQQSIRLSKGAELTETSLKEIWASDITECPKDFQKELVESKEILSDSKALEKLESLIGLDAVKRIISETRDLVEIEKMRNPENPLSDQTLHMAFAGNPGTGKTTVARLVGEIFYDMGVLPTGHVVEVDRSKLVGKHIGETAQITKKCLEEALGGVLFVDEAYTLIGDKKDFGQEAIDTILKFMEDHRDKLIVIFAGYNDEINEFLESNPGLRSRVCNILNFEDYSHDELFKIAELVISEKELKASKEVLESIVREVELEKNSGEHFANARSVRNFIEKIKKKQASRLVLLKRENRLNEDDIYKITLDDVA